MSPCGSKEAAVPSARDPAVPAVARGHSFIDIRHLYAAQIVLRDLVAGGVHVDAEEARGVQSEDLLLHSARQGRVMVPGDERLGDVEAPERFDLPLRRAVPDRIRAPEHMVSTEG